MSRQNSLLQGLSMRGARYLFRLSGAVTAAALLAAAMAHTAPSNDPTVEELKARLTSTSLRDRPRLCVEIAQKQLTETDKFYAANEIDKGQAALTDVVAFSEMARDYAIQSHKYQKQTEIAARSMTRKLTDLLHTLARDDQGPVRDAINHLQRVRDDLLFAMFPKGAK
jgi:hypothetical protein